jgi:serine/threonine protein kinase
MERILKTVKPTFAERLAGSRLLTEAQLASARAVAGDDETELGEYLAQKGLLTPFQLRQLRAGATTFFVSHYVVVDRIGRGANSVVYKARHTLMPNRYAALKTIDTQRLHVDNALARFRREIKIVAALDHPNLVRAYDVVRTRTQTFLVLEYVPGQDLGNLVKERGPLPIGEAVDYAVQAARGLGYAHQCGIVHRDLKPANLLLTPAGVVKLTDLGLARLPNKDEGLTIPGRCLGTPEFMAPEQAEDASKADERSDLYALGSTLFHLLTGELPVQGNNYMHTLQKLLLVAPRPLIEARPDVPPALADVVDRLRAREPGLRPASAGEVISLLEPFARPAAGGPRLWDRRRKTAVVLEVLQGRASAEEACAREGLEEAELEHWRQCFLQAGELALDPAAALEEERIRDLHAQIGAQAMEIQALKKRLGEKC